MRRLDLRCAALSAACLLAAAAAGADGAHRDAVRDYLIVRHCGLQSDDVTAGFRIEVIDLASRGRVSPADARIDRRAAAEHVRRHWRNRGMGRHDPRCLSVGRAAVERFLGVLEAPD